MAKRWASSATAREAKARLRQDLERKRQLRTWAIVGVLTALVGVIGIIIAFQPLAPTGSGVGVQPGQLAPDITVTDIDGRTFSLSAQQGKVVLLDFMGVNCGPCRQEMPHLVATYNALHPRGLVIISIDVGFPQLTASGPDDARNFMQSFGGRWPIALQGGSTAGATFHVTGIPTFFVIDKQGVVRFHPQQFPVTERQFEAWIQPLLQEG